MSNRRRQLLHASQPRVTAAAITSAALACKHVALLLSLWYNESYHIFMVAAHKFALGIADVPRFLSSSPLEHAQHVRLLKSVRRSPPHFHARYCDPQLHLPHAV